jgi:ribonuclease H2 subunit C
VPADYSEDEDLEQPEPVKLLEITSTVDEILVWGHDQTPALDDPYIRGVEEWIAFANAIHGSHDATGTANP